MRQLQDGRLLQDQNREMIEAEVTARSARPLNKLSPKQRQAIFLHLQGVSTTDIAEELDFTVAWVSTILSDPLSKQIIERHQELAKAEMYSLATEAVKVQRDSLRSREEKHRLRASETVLKAVGMLDKDNDTEGSVRILMKEVLDRVSARSGKTTIRVIEERRGIEIEESE